ncbi:hypothetical protein [Compostimonas suwonensis]|uniref:Lipoprotein n=1 Tax=Compostimonas suwonensis TaxID=1048394 RepID=A0A2M9BZZ7_9MICO|nr:hypothetical protein [Compostimonas suwonensis]PJJ63642.1 hypothetical protein CLV54_1313 [Compostimonas suwonensis]
MTIARMTTAAALGALAVLGASFLTGCTTSAGAGSTQMLVVVDDQVMRSAGSSCGGGGPYRWAHAGVAYTLLGADEQVLASGELPQGTATKVADVDFGDRQEPTRCEMSLTVPDPGSWDGVVLQIDDRDPLPVDDSDTPKVVIS